MHDALLLFTHNGHIHPDVVAQASRVAATLTKKQKSKLLQNVARLSAPATDFVAEAARQAEGRAGPHTAQAIAVANRLGLKELLAT